MLDVTGVKQHDKDGLCSKAEYSDGDLENITNEASSATKRKKRKRQDSEFSATDDLASKKRACFGMQLLVRFLNF
jgi:hypothetical protein